jgi:hypothetical protein
MANESVPILPETDGQIKSVLDLAGKLVEILKAHPSHTEAHSACIIAGELLKAGARNGPVFRLSSDG